MTAVGSLRIGLYFVEELLKYYGIGDQNLTQAERNIPHDYYFCQ